SLVKMAPSLALGLLLSLPGLLPIVLLNRGASESAIEEANRIQVFERLPHHLLITGFSPGFVERFSLLTVCWCLAALLARVGAPDRRVQRFVLGTLVIAIGGVMITFALQSDPQRQANLLRFYWYRMSDVCVPVGLALLIAEMTIAIMRRWPK